MKLRVFGALGAILLIAATLVQMPVMAKQDTPQPPKDNDTWVFVCKYVGIPNVNETLKEGKQPIRVKSSATVGSYFNDAQGRSYVLDTSTNANTGQGNEYLGDKTCPSGVVTPTPVAHLSYDITCDEHDAVVVTIDNTGNAAGSVTLQGQVLTIPAGQSVEHTYASGTEITLVINGQTINDIYTCESDEPQEPGRGGNTTPTTPVTPVGEGAVVTTPVVTHLPTTSGSNTALVIAILAGVSTFVAAVGYAAQHAMRRYM